MCETIPKTGILIPTRNFRLEITHGAELGAGFIHALTTYKDCRFDPKRWISFSAYAFGVVAYGNEHRRDLACKLLYISDIDGTPQKTTRMRHIRKWLKSGLGPTNEEVKKLFPNFKPFKEKR